MVSGVSGNYSVTQTYTRNVEEADFKNAQKTGFALPKAPNQNVQEGSFGAFKSSLSYFTESLKGFFEAPLGKKIEFLKDRIELRAIQKNEAGQIAPLDRKDVATMSGMRIEHHALQSGSASSMLRSNSDREIAQLSISLGDWLKEIDGNVKASGKSYGVELERAAGHVTANLTEQDWAHVDVAGLKKLEGQFRSEGRVAKADLLKAIIGNLEKEFTPEKAEALFGGKARSYVSEYEGEVHSFWRNSTEGSNALSSLVAQSFKNPLKHEAYGKMTPHLDKAATLESMKDLGGTKSLTKEQAATLGKLAEQLFGVLEEIKVTDGMKSPMEKIAKDIQTLRTDDKNSVTQKFFVNGILLKALAPEFSVRSGDLGKLTVALLYDAVVGSRADTTSPYGKEMLALKERIGGKVDDMLQRFGMPASGRTEAVVLEGVSRKEKQIDSIAGQLKEVDLYLAENPIEERKIEPERKPVDLEKIQQRNRQILDKFKL
ncbi:hypothetical protein [Aquibium sp. ELW1220]|uniref:hypothetical protein n=1 Tax=Aquibium sp. ELW1220 TaxID=2976766 RepID=UPI0025B1BDBF|nr:hypothetical protein [Aquibium sp. ELW1220]MDN2582503.1 hypothetical protein [Aquibium sp. ELW1220]